VLGMKETTELTKAIEREDVICVLELIVRTEIVLDGLLSHFELEPTCKEQETALRYAKGLHKELRATREAAGFSISVDGDSIQVTRGDPSNN